MLWRAFVVTSFFAISNCVIADTPNSVINFNQLLLRSVLGLALCIGLFCILVAVLKKLQTTPSEEQPSLKLIRRLPLSNKSSLCLVECEGVRYLVSVGADVSPIMVASQPKDKEETAQAPILDVVGGS
jgi:flagellar biogenesis protein FliO